MSVPARSGAVIVRQWQVSPAAAISVAMAGALLAATGGYAMDPVAQRSRDMIAGVSELDARTAQALQDRSLERLHDIYRDLEKKSLDVEKLMSSGGNSCGCDVAYASLLVAVGFAVNKLDGEGRYAPWMKIESLRLLDNYKSLANDCAVDAGRTGFNSRIQSQYIETL